MSLRTLLTGAVLGLSVSCIDADELEHCGQQYASPFTTEHLKLEALAVQAEAVTKATPETEICDLLERMQKVTVAVFKEHTWVRKDGEEESSYIELGEQKKIKSKKYVPGKEFTAVKWAGLSCYTEPVKLAADGLKIIRQEKPDQRETIMRYGCILSVSQQCMGPDIDFEVIADSTILFSTDVTYEKEQSDRRVRGMMGYAPVYAADYENAPKGIPIGELTRSAWVAFGKPFAPREDFFAGCSGKTKEQLYQYAVQLADFASEIVARE